MLRLILVTGLSLVLSYIPVSAADLYKIDINDKDQLQLAIDVIGRARGTIDGGFLVVLGREQVSRLRSGGLKPDLILAGYDGTPLALIIAQEMNYGKPLPGVMPLYSGDGIFVVYSADISEDHREGDGYIVHLFDSAGVPFYCPNLLPESQSRQDFPSDSLADLVNQDSLRSYVCRLEAFGSRLVYSDSLSAAGHWIADKFREFGYDNIELGYFTYHDRQCFNVVCRKPGTLRPDEHIVIGAHYDSYNHDTTVWTVCAPGADDNASGTAAVLELARIFRDVEFNKSLIFAAFTVEEFSPYTVGSEYLAQELQTAGTDITLMINFDMIGYRPDIPDTTIIFYGRNNYYGPAFAAAASRVGEMSPFLYAQESASDDYSFAKKGYATVCVTSMRRWSYYPYYHTNRDSATYLKFPYMEKTLRYVAAGIGQIDNAPEMPRFSLYDKGDGQTLRLEIANCREDYTYRIYYDTVAGNWWASYRDTVQIPPQTCNWELTGLIEGQYYHMALAAMTSDSSYSMALHEDSLDPRLIPRHPEVYSIDIDSLKLTLAWKPNIELDFQDYRLLRKAAGSPWMAVAEGVIDTAFIDTQVQGHQPYSYVVLALDSSQNISDTSNSVTATPATFDKPLLLVDETTYDAYAPPEIQQTMFYSMLLNGAPYERFNVDAAATRLSRSRAGEYGAIFWIDDDNTGHYLNNSLDSLDWYLGYGVDMFVEGWQSVYGVTGPSHLYPGDFFYDHFGISRVQICSQGQFMGADSEGDWPDLELIAGAPIYGQMANITIFDAAPYGEVIYRFRSNVPGSYYDGKPVGVAYNTGFGKRVVLGFPLMYLTEASAQGVVQRVLAYFGETETHYGDFNHDGRVNIQDVTATINYLYKGGMPPAVPSDVDVNGDCAINIKDITYLIKYLYQSGAAPVAGCMD